MFRDSEPNRPLIHSGGLLILWYYLVVRSAVLVSLALSASVVLAAPGQKSDAVATNILSQAGSQPEYPPVFAFPGISVPLNIVGDARIASGGLYLTRAVRSQAGAAWFPRDNL